MTAVLGVVTRSVILDVIVILAAGAAVLSVELWGQPFIRGYSCSDASIRLPYRESTVSTLVLIIAFVIGGFLLIMLVELLLTPSICAPSTVRCRSRALPIWVVHLYRSGLTFLLGAAITQMLTDIAKYHVGALRPHFLDVCESSVNCNAQEDAFAYISDYTCRGNPKHYTEARLSFPSGHASISFYCAIFIVGPPQNLACFLLRPLLQGMALMAAWYTSVSRVMDNMHHFRDIFMGAIIGTVIALSIIHSIKPFRKAALLDPHSFTPLCELQTSSGNQQNHHMSAPVSPA